MNNHDIFPSHIAKTLARVVGVLVGLALSAIAIQLSTGSLSDTLHTSLGQVGPMVSNTGYDNVVYEDTVPEREVITHTYAQSNTSMKEKIDILPEEYRLWTEEEFLQRETEFVGEHLYDYLRVRIVEYLQSQGYQDFVRKPGGDQNTRSIQLLSGYFLSGDTSAYALSMQAPVPTDAIDIWLAQRYSAQDKNRSAWLLPAQREKRNSVYAFTSTRQLQMMGYEVVSHRSRVAEDEEYRRYNIKQAFDSLGHVRVINPGTLSFMGAIDFDSQQRTRYRYGNGIVNGRVVPLYGGGVCGASTALFQGTITNTALSIDARNHSKRYTDLYSASINGTFISTPGIDATVYSTTIDVKLTNTASYPVILISNFDGEYGSTEEVFTLSQPQDQGSIRFLRSYLNTNGTHRCYVRLINGESQHICYQTVD